MSPYKGNINATHFFFNTGHTTAIFNNYINYMAILVPLCELPRECSIRMLKHFLTLSESAKNAYEIVNLLPVVIAQIYYFKRIQLCASVSDS